MVTGLLTLHSKHHSQVVYGVAAQPPGMRYAEPVKHQMNEFNELYRKIGEIMIQNSHDQEDDWMVVISKSVFNNIWTRGKKVSE